MKKPIFFMVGCCMLFKLKAQEADNRFLTLFPEGTVITENASKLSVSGEARFFTSYRNMAEQYQDNTTSNQNISFTSYPLSGAGAGNSGGIPLLNIELEAKPRPDYSFKLGYSFNHSFSGLREDSSKIVSARSNLQFGGEVETNAGNYAIEAGGGIIWTSLSKMTMQALDYEDDEFDRLPWDHYTSSWDRYNDIYEHSEHLGGESFENVAMQGIVLNGTALPHDLGLRAFYGRSWASVDQERARNRFPSNTLGFRLTKDIYQNQIGINHFAQIGRTSTSSDTADTRSVTSANLKFNSGRISGYGELAFGTVNNPDLQNGSGLGFIGEVNFKKSVTRIPITLHAFHINKNVASNVSAAMNSNIHARAGGFRRDPVYNTQEFINPTLQVGQYANNRQGLSLTAAHNVKGLKIELGLGLSKELEALHDTVIFLHRANAFSRSRFNPWIQNAGPYGRIKSIFRRTFEIVEIYEEEAYSKYFNTLDLKLRYKTSVLGKQVILKNISNYNSIQSSLSATPLFSDQAYVRSFYNQSLIFIQLNSKFSALGFYETETNKGNSKTSPSEINTPIDQTGTGYGFGLDYDFSDFAGIYFRHRWMKHQDNNLVLDRFEGQESTIELKIFF